LNALRNEGGQAIVLVAITMLGLIMAVGLGFDSGALFNGRRTAQEAADSAAFAGATVLYQKGCPWVTCTSTQVGVATSAAAQDAYLNGYCRSGTPAACTADSPTSGTTVTVTSPPSAGSFANNALCVQVVISTPVRTTLVPPSPSFTTVKATGTACAAQWNGAYGLMATDTNCDDKALQEQSNGSIVVKSSNLQVDSCASSDAAYAKGTVKLDSGYVASITGGASPWTLSGGGTTSASTGTVQADPFAGTPGPPTTGLSAQSCAGPTLSPGIYTCTIGNGTYVMSAGYYIFEGGGLSMAGNSSITGTGVLIFLTNSNYPSSSSCTGSCSCASFSLTGNGANTLSAATTGPYAGMLIFQDPNCSGSLTIGGNGQVDTLTGSIYLPTGTLTLDGQNATIGITQIIAYQENVQNGNVTINYSAASAYIGYLPALME
jgi:putative Flp pilus-assembly TadE/G-like protein